MIFIKNEHWVINVCLIFNFLGYLYFAFRNNFDNFEILFLDLLLILILNFVFSPLLAFTAYFCFLHSIRHIISIVLELDEANFLNGIKLFVKGSMIIFAPLFFHTDETLGIFEILFVKDSIFLNFIKFL